MRSDHLRLSFREREVDDVLKSLVVVEQGLSPKDKPSTVTALLPEEKSGHDAEDTTFLDLVLSPATSRPVSIAYAVPTAAWKATYRVILPDPAEKPSRGALLQAWALIDNVSDEDWNSVRMTLATGAPLSYSSNLRTPRFIQRPDVSGTFREPTVNGPVASERTPGVDRDGDGIPDAEDACPAEPGRAAPDRSKNGCPQFSRVVVSESSIQIIQHVQFDKDADAIRPASRPILDSVAQVLRQNPQIK